MRSIGARGVLLFLGAIFCANGLTATSAFARPDSIKPRPNLESVARRLSSARDLPTRSDPGCAFGPGDLPFETVGKVATNNAPIPLGDEMPVHYIFVLMQENRSFDSYFGRFQSYLREVKQYPSEQARAADPRLRAFTSADVADGIDVPGTPYHLLSDEARARANGNFAPNAASSADAPYNPSVAGTEPRTKADKHYWMHHRWQDASTKIPGLCLSDTAHEWWAAHLQWNAGAMDGFFQSNHLFSEGGSPRAPERKLLSGERALFFYDEHDIPFYYWLADTFAIGDRYFSSVLGPTFVNRDYLYGATSRGLTSNASDKFNGSAAVAYRYAGKETAIPTAVTVRGRLSVRDDKGRPIQLDGGQVRPTTLNTIYDALSVRGVRYTQWVRQRYNLAVPKYSAFTGDAPIGGMSKYTYDATKLGGNGFASYLAEEEKALKAKIAAARASKVDVSRIGSQGSIFPVNFLDPDISEDVNGEDEHTARCPANGSAICLRHHSHANAVPRSLETKRVHSYVRRAWWVLRSRASAPRVRS